MKKYLVYIVLLILGIVLGGFIFSGLGKSSANPETSVSAHSKIHASNNQAFWTCSMHPQVMKTEPGNCPICDMELIPAEGDGQGLGPNRIRMSKNAMTLADIQTTIVGNAGENAENTISLSGKIVQNEEKTAIQASYFDGRIEKLNVNFEGQQVQKGQLLATVYAPDLVAAQQELLTAASLKNDQPQLYKAVRNKLKLWKLSEKRITSIEKSGEIIENFPVYATVSGTVAEVMSAAGDYVKRGQPLLKVSNLDNVWAEFDAYENQIDQLQQGDSIGISANAYPNRNFKAQISFIDPTLNIQSRTLTVRATLSNRENLLKPGMFVTGTVKVGTAQDSTNSEMFHIPASAVLWTGERSLVYLKTDKNAPVFEMREVVLGNRNGDAYEITDGLEKGDELVTNGTFTVDAAAQLQDKRSMMNEATLAHGETVFETLEFPERFQADFKAIIPDYLLLKDAFVEGDTAEISALAKKIGQYLSKTDHAALGAMEKSHFNRIVKNARDISKAEDLEKQRGAFVILNENMVAVVKNCAGYDMPLYIQKCPMAANNKGAMWLSDIKTVKNPYYGDVMVSCGSVIDSISR